MNAGLIEEAWTHYQLVQKLNNDLAEPENDPIQIESDIKVNLGIRLLQADSSVKA